MFVEVNARTVQLLLRSIALILISTFISEMVAF